MEGPGQRYRAAFAALLILISVTAAAVALPGRSDDAGAAVRVPKTVAAVGLGPQPQVELEASAQSALPGDRVDYTARVTNAGTQLLFSGGLKVRNTKFTTAEVAYFSHYVSYYSLTTRKWVNLAGWETKKPGYTPRERVPIASGLSIQAAPLDQGPSYPAGDDRIGQTTVPRLNTASWNYNGQVAIDPELAAQITDRKKVSRLRASTHFELIPTEGAGYYRYRKAQNFPKFAAGTQNRLTGQLALQRPGGSSAGTFAVDLLEGESTTRQFNHTLPVLSGKAASESEGDYLSRLNGEDGKQFTGRATFTPQGGAAHSSEVATSQRVPILSLDKTGPEQATTGQSINYQFAMANSGSAAASPALTDAVDGGSAEPVAGTPASIGPGGQASAQHAFNVPFNRAEGGLTDVGRLSWKDARDNSYGPITDGFTTQVSKPIEPPDPGASADSDPERSNVPLSEANTFLYEGEDAVQHGVAEGAIDRKRGAVVRGTIKDVDGNPIAGAIVTVKDHPEFGSAESQPDGSVYMMVNGGGSLTVRFEKQGYIGVDRTFQVPWDDYAFFDDVVMTQYDTAATDIDVSTPLAPAQVARANPVSDEDGTRRPTIFVPEGTTANMRMPDGSLQQLDNMRVRMTEFTVGETGEDAMPAPLPATSAYTWAADFSVDEAEAAGAESVEFSQPVIGYIENFIDFPVGTIVPSGTYDRDAAAWVPEKNGKVIKVVSESGGLAEVDTDGNGTADDGLSMTESEREKLALMYEPGEELWRVLTEHFSIFDWNFPFTLPWDAETDPGSGPNQKDVDCPSPEKGSVIECENQGLGEDVPVAGVSDSLHYRSSRVEGREDARTTTIKLLDSTPPASLREIRVEVRVAGRAFRETVSPAPNKSYSFTWDGVDAFGRQPAGPQPAQIQLRYIYPEFYYGQPTQSPAAFARRSSVTAAQVEGRGTVEVRRSYSTSLGVSDHRAAGLGGWSLADHHTYDARSATVFMGDGRSRRSVRTESMVERFAGGVSNSFCGDGGPALNACIQSIEGIDVGPDGSIYMADHYNGRIRKVDPNGVMTTVAGSGQGNGALGFAGDGGPATQAKLHCPHGVAVAEDGSFYIADRCNYRIRKVDADGIITTVVGGGSQGVSDGVLGTDVGIGMPWDVAIGPDGDVYFVGGGGIYRLGQDGRVFPLGGWASDPISIAVGPTGDIYVGEGTSVRGGQLAKVKKLAPDGKVSLFAGTGQAGFNGDGGPAPDADLNRIEGIDVDLQGNVYLADAKNDRIRKVSPDGVISTVAGGPPDRPSAFAAPGPATDISLRLPHGVAVAPDGAIYIGTWGQNFVSRMAGPLPGLSDGDISIPSEDGSELYIFNRSGRHLRTMDTQTGQALLRFSYDSEGRLTKMKDADGEETLIDHDSEGNPTQIVGPDGHTTELEVNADGYLKTIRDPAGEETRMTYYGEGGLLQTFRDNKGNTSTMTYDSLGRLIRDDDPEGGYKTLSRTETDSGREVTLTTAQGRTKKFAPEDLPTGDTKRTKTSTDGKQSTQLRGTDGSRNMDYPDGTKVKVERGPDPRFGMLSPIAKRVETKLPSGKTNVTTASRTATLLEPGDPLSHTVLESTATTNGRTQREVYSRIHQRITSTSPANRTTTTNVDFQGRPTQVTVPGIDPTSFSYDTRGRPTGSLQGTRTASVTYDGQGNVATSTDSLGRTQSFTYDAVGRVKTQTLPDTRAISYDYDANGNLTSITPPSRPAHTFVHNGIDQPTRYVAPDLDPNTHTTETTYTQDHEVAFVDRPGSADIDFDYDSAGRLATVTEPVGTYDFNYWDETGQLKNINAPGGITTAFHFDGALPTNETQAGPVPGITARAYDNNFWVTSTSVNGGNTVNYGYDNDGLLTSAGPLTLQRSAQNGLLAGTSLGATQTTITRNNYGEPVSLQASHGGGPLLSQIYTRDNGGRVVDKQETTDQGSATYNYAYDTTGRLTEVKRNGATQVTYAYDQNGNRTSVTRPGQGMLLATYDAQDRLQTYGTKSFQYTQAGDLAFMSDAANGETTDYDYDAQGGLRAVRVPNGDQIEYLIDGRGQRVGKKVNGSLRQGWLYGAEAQGPIAELRPDASVESRFVYATRSNVPDYMEKGGRTYRIITDDLGSPRVVVDTADGSIAQRMDFDEFGRVVRDTNPGFQPFGYAGGLYDVDTKLVRFGARDYDPETGRWTSKDPIGFAGGDTNLYGYVLADPVNFVDPEGHFAPLVVGAIVVGGAIVGTLSAVDQARSCNDGFWAVSKAFGRGFAGGSAGTATTIGTTLLVKNPVAAGAAGGAVDSAVQGALGGGQSATDIGASSLVGGATAGLGPKIGFTRPLYKYPGRRPDLFAPRGPGTTREYGVNSQRYLGQQALEAGTGASLSTGSSCQCS